MVSALVQDEAICFSLIANLRCQGISKTNTIAAFIPSAIEILLVPTLLAVAWTRPRSTLILLAVELTLSSGISIWDLILRLGLGSIMKVETFHVEDTALAITSSLPILFFLLFQTSYLLTDLRPYLPPSFKSRTSTHIFVIFIAPLIPIGFVGSLLPSFLLLVYTTTKTSLVQISFATTSDQTLHQILSDVGIIASCTYTLFILFLNIILFSLSSRSTSTKGNGERWPRWIIAFALFLAAIEISLAVIPPSLPLPGAGFLIIIVRKSLRLLSRLLLVVGLVGLYRPGRGGLDVEGNFEIVPSTSSKGRGNRDRDTVSTFGTPLPTDYTEKTTKINLPNDLNLKEKGKDKKGKKKPTPLKLQIGNPVEGTFKTMGTSATKGFYALHSDRLKGMGMEVVGIPNERGENVVPPIGRVIFRTPAARAPVLSFTSSIFDSSALEGLVRDTQPQSRYPSPAIPSAQPRTARTNTTITMGMGMTKKFTGSIYAPSRVSIDQSMLSQWPPAPATSRSNTPGVTARGIMGSTVLGTNALGQLSYPQSQPQTKTYRTDSGGGGGGSRERGIRIIIPDQQGDEAIALGGPIINHPPAISREPSESETSQTSTEKRSRLPGQQEEAIRVRTTPRYKVTDVITPVNALPRVNSVRRKPVPQVQHASPASTFGTNTNSNSINGGGGGIEVKQYFTLGAGARRSLVDSGSTHKRWNSNSSTSFMSLSSNASASSTKYDASQRSQLPKPPMPKRKSTDPTTALSSSPLRSHSLLRSQSSNDTRQSTKLRSRETIMSPSSEYSHTLASPISTFNDNDDGEREKERDLFFSTPTQSPSEDDHSIPVPIPSRRSIHFNNTEVFTQIPPLPISALQSTKSTANSSISKSESASGRERQSDVRAVLASLSRLQKDTGIETDLSRLTMITTSTITSNDSGLAAGFEYDITDNEAEGQGQIRYSLSSSSVESDDMTPKAEVMPRPKPTLKVRNYGGVI